MHDETNSPAPAAREMKFCALDLKRVSLDGDFEGYACLFHKEDLGRDIVLPGAFRDSLAERGPDGIKMLYQHDPGQPIGVWQRLHEDARGLFVRGRLMTELARAREVLSLMRAGAVDGLSIGFRAVRSQRDPRSRLRRLIKVDLWEISIVTFPMQPEARIARLKSAPFAHAAPTERELERWLTQDAGFTRSEARALMRDGLKGLKPLRDAGHGQAREQRLADRLAEVARILRLPITRKGPTHAL
ncbi:MAG: HK97 family phage prohead protease [Hyphomicrobiaceae bacterium]|nr:HK97 family phage prohead protease [Hyphomicrobiaceae bacterium]